MSYINSDFLDYFEEKFTEKFEKMVEIFFALRANHFRDKCLAGSTLTRGGGTGFRLPQLASAPRWKSLPRTSVEAWTQLFT